MRKFPSNLTSIILATLLIISNSVASINYNQFKFENSKSAISATLGSYINNLDYIKDLDKVSNTIATSVANSAISSGLSGLYGTDFKDSFIVNLGYSIGDNLFNYAGDLGILKDMSEGSLGKTITHSLVGGTTSSILGNKFLDGAIISGTREALSPLSNNLGKDEQLLTSQLTGIIVGSLLNDTNGANLGYNLATSGELNNRQLHKKEVEWLKDKDNITAFQKELNSNSDGKIYSYEEASSILAKGGVSLNDNSFSNAYINIFQKMSLII